MNEIAGIIIAFKALKDDLANMTLERDEWKRRVEMANFDSWSFYEPQLTAAKDQIAVLEAALKYPRFGNTAKLLRVCADAIDMGVKPPNKSLLTPHMRNAAKAIEEALSYKINNITKENSNGPTT